MYDSNRFIIDICQSNVMEMLEVCIKLSTVKAHSTNTSLIQTPHYYRQFPLSLGKESPYIFSKFNPLNMDAFYTPLSVHINGVGLYSQQ